LNLKRNKTPINKLLPARVKSVLPRMAGLLKMSITIKMAIV
jgi:hypothetical protein